MFAIIATSVFGHVRDFLFFFFWTDVVLSSDELQYVCAFDEDDFFSAHNSCDKMATY